MFRRPIMVRRGAPLLRGALVGGAGFMLGRQTARAADRDAEQDAAIAQMQNTPPPVSLSPQPGDDLTDRLARLASLHAEGVLTDDEFAAAKSRLLGA
jgi:hypothetical protein